MTPIYLNPDIKGPSETPYEGGVFQLVFSVPEQYPLQPPQVRFLTKIFYPNVHFKVNLLTSWQISQRQAGDIIKTCLQCGVADDMGRNMSLGVEDSFSEAELAGLRQNQAVVF